MMYMGLSPLGRWGGGGVVVSVSLSISLVCFFCIYLSTIVYVYYYYIDVPIYLPIMLSDEIIARWMCCAMIISAASFAISLYICVCASRVYIGCICMMAMTTQRAAPAVMMTGDKSHTPPSGVADAATRCGEGGIRSKSNKNKRSVPLECLITFTKCTLCTAHTLPLYCVLLTVLCMCYM